MKLQLCILSILILSIAGCKNKNYYFQRYESKTLIIHRIAADTYVHTSYLYVPGYGKVASNGMICVDKKEAIVFDTPANDTAASELIEYVEKKMKYKIKAVVINHFHEDCLGGIKEFHKRSISSFASERTIDLAGKDMLDFPTRAFKNRHIIDFGKKQAINQYFGQGHTHDNIVSYIPGDEILFGGCLIKALGASKGNLNDANTGEWSRTVSKIKQAYPNLKVVVPGHGKYGGAELLDYTIELFSIDTLVGID